MPGVPVVPLPNSISLSDITELVVASVVVVPLTVKSPVIVALPPTDILLAKVKLPELSPEIQVVVVEPSKPAIINCLLPVAELGSCAEPIITLPEPLVILSPAFSPITRFLTPVIFFPALSPIAILLLPGSALPKAVAPIPIFPSGSVAPEPASLPMKIFNEPSVKLVPALRPIAVSYTHLRAHET